MCVCYLFSSASTRGPAKRVLVRHGLQTADLRRFVAGLDAFSAERDENSVAAEYRKFGIKLRPANVERVGGWAEVMQRLGDPEAGVVPRSFIHQRCGRLAQALPGLQHDPNRPEDVLKVDCDEEGVSGDDAADALRYLVASGARKVEQKKLMGM